MIQGPRRHMEGMGFRRIVVGHCAWGGLLDPPMTVLCQTVEECAADQDVCTSESTVWQFFSTQRSSCLIDHCSIDYSRSHLDASSLWACLSRFVDLVLGPVTHWVFSQRHMDVPICLDICVEQIG